MGYDKRPILSLRNVAAKLFRHPRQITRWGLAILLCGLFAGVLTWVFAEFAEELLEDDLVLYDREVTSWVQKAASPGMTVFMKGISHLGGNWVALGLISIGVSYVLYQRQRHYWDALILQLCLWGGWLINTLLKLGFKRERPTLEWLVDADGFSFPSGHSMISFAFYGMLTYLLWLNLPRSYLRVILTGLLLIFVIMVGISRIYLGVHYPSDVAGGFAAGGIWLAICVVALEAVRKYKGKKEADDCKSAKDLEK